MNKEAERDDGRVGLEREVCESAPRGAAAHSAVMLIDMSVGIEVEVESLRRREHRSDKKD